MYHNHIVRGLNAIAQKEENMRREKSQICMSAMMEAYEKMGANVVDTVFDNLFFEAANYLMWMDNQSSCCVKCREELESDEQRANHYKDCRMNHLLPAWLKSMIKDSRSVVQDYFIRSGKTNYRIVCENDYRGFSKKWLTIGCDSEGIYFHYMDNTDDDEVYGQGYHTLFSDTSLWPAFSDQMMRLVVECGLPIFHRNY